MNPARLLVLNPNSVVAVTEAIDRALQPFRQGAVAIRCETLASGPRVIATQADVDGLTPGVLGAVTDAHAAAPLAAAVVACFSDPGVQALRETVGFPVYGIAESAYLNAIPLAERFGVISILQRGVARHARQIRALGLEHRLAADHALDLAPEAFADPARRYARLVEVGMQLRDAHGAGVLILGCAGLSEVRAPLQRELGVRVIDPVQAAVAQALGALLPDHFD